MTSRRPLVLRLITLTNTGVWFRRKHHARQEASHLQPIQSNIYLGTLPTARYTKVGGMEECISSFPQECQQHQLHRALPEWEFQLD